MKNKNKTKCNIFRKSYWDEEKVTGVGKAWHGYLEKTSGLQQTALFRTRAVVKVAVTEVLLLLPSRSACCLRICADRDGRLYCNLAISRRHIMQLIRTLFSLIACYKKIDNKKLEKLFTFLSEFLNPETTVWSNH